MTPTTLQTDTQAPTPNQGSATRIAIEVSDPGGRDALRRREPVTVGLPFPRGFTHDAAFALLDPHDVPVPLQTRILDRWSDGSVKWALFDFRADTSATIVNRYHLCAGPGAGFASVDSPLRISERADGITIDTGVARFEVRANGCFPFDAVTVGGTPAIDRDRTAFEIDDASGTRSRAHISRVEVEESGPLRATVKMEGTVGHYRGEPLLSLIARLSFFAGSATVRFALTLRNVRRAVHPGGFWELGDAGSVSIRDASLTFALDSRAGPAEIDCSPEADMPMEMHRGPLELYQDSSGGDNWHSPNHLNRSRMVPNTFRGYRLRSGTADREGLRATPTVALKTDTHQLVVAMQHFWQNFPKAIEASSDSITLRLFPKQYADLHEIQGGEQKTHTFFVAFGPDRVSQLPLAWCCSPLFVRAEPSWYCGSGAVRYLVPRADDPNVEYRQLVDAAIEGDDAFERKREIIDEYGWRNFGDIYADHEAVAHTGSSPLVSHYNNQYDAIAGFGYQFLRSGDLRWWTQMNELASHVADIDIYHTDRDKSAYNHGLFWHTAHYVDAGIATHRTYPRADNVGGGGPSAEHNYATGLTLHHFLTGDPVSRETAIGLARFVIDIDDGRKTIFRWLDRGRTGLASASGSPLYHGPGRAAGNSLNVLIEGHRLTGDAAFLVKAEQLISRCIHPADDIAGRDLLDAERRWFYTVFLQALGRYLDYKAEMGAYDFTYAYARASLLHYARWMAEHEYPYLDKPELLEYPTETWAAMDMRKSEVFKLAAKYAQGTDRDRFLERSDFFFQYSTTTLGRMKTKTLTRPTVLMLSYGLTQAYFQKHAPTASPPPDQSYDFGRPASFTSQKERAKRRGVAALATAGLVATVILGWFYGLV